MGRYRFSTWRKIWRNNLRRLNRRSNWWDENIGHVIVWCFIIIVIFSPLMEHHLRCQRRLCRRLQVKQLDVDGGVTRKVSLIKNCMTADDDFLVHWIPELPCFHSFSISNKDALFGVGLQGFPVILVNQDIGKTTKHSEI